MLQIFNVHIIFLNLMIIVWFIDQFCMAIMIICIQKFFGRSAYLYHDFAIQFQVFVIHFFFIIKLIFREQTVLEVKCCYTLDRYVFLLKHEGGVCQKCSQFDNYLD